jgi:hypothetical protein
MLLRQGRMREPLVKEDSDVAKMDRERFTVLRGSMPEIENVECEGGSNSRLKSKRQTLPLRRSSQPIIGSTLIAHRKFCLILTMG